MLAILPSFLQPPYPWDPFSGTLEVFLPTNETTYRTYRAHCQRVVAPDLDGSVLGSLELEAMFHNQLFSSNL